MIARPTVYDVARVAGVSIKTVSRVVNGSDKVSDITRKRVLTAVADLDYVRNAAALSLRTGVGSTIGIVVDSIADPFFATLVSVVEERALAVGISVLVASTGRSARRERDHIQRLSRQNIGALLLAPSDDDHSYLLDTVGAIPVVLIDRGWKNSGFDTIRVHDRTGARMATEHLIAYGHRRIAFIGDVTDLPTIVSRRGGYEDALTMAGITVDPALMRTGHGESGPAAAAMDDLLGLADPPTAVFSSNPRASLGVVRALHRRHRTDVAMVGFGDFALADTLDPAVTIIDQDPTPMAAAAADRLLARIAGARPTPAEIVLPVSLVARGSGELTCSRS